jgi:hypothetical protein
MNALVLIARLARAVEALVRARAARRFPEWRMRQLRREMARYSSLTHHENSTSARSKARPGNGQAQAGQPQEERTMSLITYRNRNTAKHPAASGRTDRAPVSFSMSTIVNPVRQAIVSVGRLIIFLAQVHAEAQMQRAKLEVELYRNRYKHASKNDDDLPIVR